MISAVHPAFIFFLGSLAVPFLKGRVKQAWLLVLPLLAGWSLLQLSPEVSGSFHLLGYELILLRVDSLSRIFGIIFMIMAFGGFLFSLQVKKDREHMASLWYVGSSLGVVLAGDFLSLFIFWEIMAFASAVLIWSGGRPGSKEAGFRYILVHLFGGLCLLVGILIYHLQTGSISFGPMELIGTGPWLILIGFILNAAAPPIHAWLPDAYPEASATGTVFLSAYTTKTAVYVLARGFAGAEVLIWAGILMTLYGIVYAILENDMRRILAYSIINQVGFMVVGIGIGTEMALNGAISHAFSHILYKALLLMSAGAVLLMTGKTKCTELGGLYKTMPYTLTFCLIGAASISAFPLFSGFVSKAMVITAAAQEGMPVVWLLLMMASAGVFLHAGIKFPYFVFFAKDSGIRTKEPPVPMLLAMALFSFLCIYLGVFPQVLYRQLPFPVDFIPYTVDHVVGQLQLLSFSALAFFLMLKQLQRTKTISIDTDWVYRKGAEGFLWVLNDPMARFGNRMQAFFSQRIPGALAWFFSNPVSAVRIFAGETVLFLFRSALADHGRGMRARIEREKQLYPESSFHLPVGSVVLWVMAFLFACLILYYL